MRRRQTDGDALGLKVCGNDAGFRFKSEIAIQAGALLNKPRKATRAIAAHLARAAIVIVELPGPIRLPRQAGNQQDNTIRAGTAVSVTQPDNLVTRKLYFLCQVIDEHK